MTQETQKKPVIAIVGLGLLGASICETLRTRLFPVYIIGISSPNSTKTALEQGLIDESLTYDEISLVKLRVDLVFLCTPIKHIFSMVEKLSESKTPWKEGAIVTDVGSTKSEICQFAWDKLGEQVFIGGHPMAGSEKNGIEARDATLFESALWLLTPSPKQTFVLAESLLFQVINALGSTIHLCDIDDHDEWLAAVSHLPQLLSTQLSVSTFKHFPQAISVAGPGYRDMSRLALSSYPMWQSILETNADKIHYALEKYIDELESLQKSLKTKNWNQVESSFETAYHGRQNLNIPQEGWSNSLIDVIVTVKDQTGMISTIVVPLSDAKLDIRDIQLLKIREGMGGTLRLSFSSIQQAKQAVKLLETLSIQAKLRSEL